MDGDKDENRNRYYARRMMVAIMYYVRYWVCKDGKYALNATEDFNEPKHLPAWFVYEPTDENKNFVGHWREVHQAMVMTNITNNVRKTNQ